jgi:hypothetical protein
MIFFYIEKSNIDDNLVTHLLNSVMQTSFERLRMETTELRVVIEEKLKDRLGLGLG